LVIHTVELRTNHYQLSRLLFLLRSIAILGLNSRSMQGQGMQKFSSILFWNMAVVIFTSDTRINRSWHCLPSCSYSHAGWYNRVFVSRILDSRIFRSDHNVSLLLFVWIRHPIFNLLQVILVLVFNSRIDWSHKWIISGDFFLGSKFRFNRAILVLSFNAWEDWSSHQSSSVKW